MPPVSTYCPAEHARDCAEPNVQRAESPSPSMTANLHAARRIALEPGAPKYRGDTDYTIRKKMRGFIILTD